MNKLLIKLFDTYEGSEVLDTTELQLQSLDAYMFATLGYIRLENNGYFREGSGSYLSFDNAVLLHNKSKTTAPNFRIVETVYLRRNKQKKCLEANKWQVKLLR